MDHFLLFVFILAILPCLFLTALSSPDGKGLIYGSSVCDVFL